MGIRRLPFVGIVTPDMHWLLSFGSMLIYKCATVAGDIIMQRRCCRNTNKGGKEGIDFQFHCVGSEAVDSVVTDDIGLGGLRFNFISFRPTLQLQVTTPCNGWAAGNTNRGGKEGIAFLFYYV